MSYWDTKNRGNYLIVLKGLRDDRHSSGERGSKPIPIAAKSVKYMFFKDKSTVEDAGGMPEKMLQRRGRRIGGGTKLTGVSAANGVSK